MTALADISKQSSVSKAAAAMYGDRLRGSDLTEFNESHPRDSAGRFASATGGGGGADPRMERQGRRMRRVRRAVKAGEVQAAVAASAAKPAEADPRALQHLARRILPRKTEDRGLQRKFAPVQTPKSRGKPALDEEGYLNHEAQTAWRRADSVFYVTTQQANQFLKTGRLVVGAANDLWGTKLSSELTSNTTLGPNQERMGMVAIRLPHPHLVEVDPDNKSTGQLDAAQVLTPKTYTKGRYIYSGMLFFDATGRQTDDKSKMVNGILEIKVDAHTPEEWASIKERMSKSAPEAIWEEDEHPRDIRSGRFTAQAGGGGGGADPRISRNMRRRRRAGRALANVAAAPAAAPVVEAPYEERGLQRKYAPVRMSFRDMVLARKYAPALVPDAPEDAQVTLQAEGGPMRTVEERVSHYEQHVYPKIRRNLAFSDDLIQRAASGAINGDTVDDVTDRVIFSNQFLSGQRLQSQYAEPITDRDVAQSIRQLQGAQRMFDLMQKHGAGQWTMTTGEPPAEEEQRPITHVSLNEADIAALSGFAPESQSSGFGARTVSMDDYRRMVEEKAEREAATAMHGRLGQLRKDKPEFYQKYVVPNLLQFSSGQTSWERAMENVADAMGDRRAAFYYIRVGADREAAEAATAETRAAAKERGLATQAKVEQQKAKEGRSVAETAVRDVIEQADREAKDVGFKEVTTTSGRKVRLQTTTYDLLEDVEPADPRVRDRGTYDPIEFDDETGRPIIPDPDTPREFVHPKLRRAFDLQNRALRSGKGRRSTS